MNIVLNSCWLVINSCSRKLKQPKTRFKNIFKREATMHFRCPKSTSRMNDHTGNFFYPNSIIRILYLAYFIEYCLTYNSRLLHISEIHYQKNSFLIPYSLEYNVALYSYNADRNSHYTRGRIIFKVALYPLPPFPSH